MKKRPPSGIIDEIQNPTINGTLTVTEGISTDVPALSNATLMAFPNPANELLTITGTSLNAPVVVTDVTGKVVLETRLATGVMPVHTLAPGLYHLTVLEGGEVRSLRFSKQ